MSLLRNSKTGPIVLIIAIATTLFVQSLYHEYEEVYYGTIISHFMRYDKDKGEMEYITVFRYEDGKITSSTDLKYFPMKKGTKIKFSNIKYRFGWK